MLLPSLHLHQGDVANSCLVCLEYHNKAIVNYHELRPSHCLNVISLASFAATRLREGCFAGQASWQPCLKTETKERNRIFGAVHEWQVAASGAWHHAYFCLDSCFSPCCATERPSGDQRPFQLDRRDVVAYTLTASDVILLPDLRGTFDCEQGWTQARPSPPEATERLPNPC